MDPLGPTIDLPFFFKHVTGSSPRRPIIFSTVVDKIDREDRFDGDEHFTPSAETSAALAFENRQKLSHIKVTERAEGSTESKACLLSDCDPFLTLLRKKIHGVHE
jgi:hypothetical protein